MVDNGALKWIISLLESNNHPYLICGGLAAIAYGSKRPLNDIDLFTSEKTYRELIELGKNYITFGPERYKDQYWNIDYVQFTFDGQKIEIGSSDAAKIFDATNNEWITLNIDFDSYTLLNILGKQVRIMNKADLVDYKQKLGRDVDITDIEQITDS